MSVESRRLELTVACSLKHWSTVSQAITRFGQEGSWSELEQHQVLFMVEELVVNAMTHGRPQAGAADGSGWVRVECWDDEDWIRMRVTDNLSPFDPRQAPPPGLLDDLETRAVGGLGVYLTLEMADSFSYEQVDGCNVVTLGKKRGPLA